MSPPPIPAHRSPGTFFASSLKKACVDVKKEVRGGIAAGGKIFTVEEKMACSIDATMIGGTCEACQ